MSNLLDSWTVGQDKVIRVGAAEAVFTSLRNAIEGGKIPVGARLDSEASLAQQYGVSRSMVREALRSCNALGLTATYTGKGTFVIADRVAQDLKLGKYSARDLVEARPHIEVPAAALAAERRTPEDVEALREILDAMADEDDLQHWVLLNAEFHATIARCSGNGVFAGVLSDIREAMADQSNTLNLVADRRKASDAEHTRIFNAIERGSAQEASRAMTRHLHGVECALVSIVPGGEK
ncbi:HTH-type transcriptional regulator LutR [Arthrobacter sp. Bi83]|jgi:DNA-binding FadR family transcriptional regulator|uniref:FadR/GntR family transcriptional regulator n=1 Tax=Arthrobacter sp. Bi83 TaxID=2822353 RepID=UPI001D7F236E|nr:FadR/GntR family transcriptional regulator [Arthrobacter sp. Bi83]CAH0162625.1 HTH-type transcriptional regulator LutR [Arthrobacter sp. Bi83]